MLQKEGWQRIDDDDDDKDAKRSQQQELLGLPKVVQNGGRKQKQVMTFPFQPDRLILPLSTIKLYRTPQGGKSGRTSRRVWISLSIGTCQKKSPLPRKEKKVEEVKKRQQQHELREFESKALVLGKDPRQNSVGKDIGWKEK